MKIEKINDNQIRCTLYKYDLASRQIKISELAYGTDKAKSLFKDMMQQAFNQFGFEAEDIPLMIEAIPISADCIILVITKVEDPDELDTRFSKFSPDSEDEDEDTQNGVYSDFSELFSKIQDGTKSSDDEGEEDFAGGEGTFIPLPETLSDVTKKDTEETRVSHELPQTKLYSILFSFEKLDDVINAAKVVKRSYAGANALYKDKDGRYLLLVSQSSHSEVQFGIVCNTLSEYGNVEQGNYASGDYLDEYCQKIIGKRALQKLARV